MYYYLLTIQYDGSNFSGWAKQKNASTIQGELERVLTSIFKSKNFHLLGASKTDAKVHALDQKVFLEVDFKFNHEIVIKSINKKINKSIYVCKIIEIDEKFKVRNCKQKIYYYQISNKKISIFDNRYITYLEFPIIFKKLKRVLKIFQGTHDFKNFCGLKNDEINNYQLVREIKKIYIKKQKEVYKIFFVSKGFLRYQIRMILGACFAYLNNEIDLNTIINTLNKKCDKLKYIAPGNGLCLKKIVY